MTKNQNAMKKNMFLRDDRAGVLTDPPLEAISVTERRRGLVVDKGKKIWEGKGRLL